MTRLSQRARAVLCGVLIGLLPGCGGTSQDPAPLSIDDAFVARMVSHLNVSAELARIAGRDAERKQVRTLARRARTVRQRLLPALEERLAGLPAVEGLPDLGVSPARAAEEVGPGALDGSKPLDVAFLTVMRRHDAGALALTRAEIARGSDPMVKDLAERLAVDLTAELGRLGAALENLAQVQRGG